MTNPDTDEPRYTAKEWVERGQFEYAQRRAERYASDPTRKAVYFEGQMVDERFSKRALIGMIVCFSTRGV